MLCYTQEERPKTIAQSNANFWHKGSPKLMKRTSLFTKMWMELLTKLKKMLWLLSKEFGNLVEILEMNSNIIEITYDLPVILLTYLL